MRISMYMQRERGERAHARVYAPEAGRKLASVGESPHILSQTGLEVAGHALGCVRRRRRSSRRARSACCGRSSLWHCWTSVRTRAAQSRPEHSASSPVHCWSSSVPSDRRRWSHSRRADPRAATRGASPRRECRCSVVRCGGGSRRCHPVDPDACGPNLVARWSGRDDPSSRMQMQSLAVPVSAFSPSPTHRASHWPAVAAEARPDQHDLPRAEQDAHIPDL